MVTREIGKIISPLLQALLPLNMAGCWLQRGDSELKCLGHHWVLVVFTYHILLHYIQISKYNTSKLPSWELNISSKSISLVLEAGVIFSSLICFLAVFFVYFLRTRDKKGERERERDFSKLGFLESIAIVQLNTDVTTSPG